MFPAGRRERPYPLRRIASRGGAAGGTAACPPRAVVGAPAARGLARRRSGTAAPIRCRSSGRRQLSDPIAERLFRDRDDRDLDAERALGLLDRLGPQVAQDRLAERHRLEREDPVPAGVQLVDHDVGALVPAARLVVAQALDDVELDVQALARLDDVLGALASAAGRRMQDDRAARAPRAAARRTGAGRAPAGSPRRPAPSEGRRTSRRSAHPRHGRTGARPVSSRGCPSRGSGAPTSCGSPSGSARSPSAARASSRSRSGRRPSSGAGA